MNYKALVSFFSQEHGAVSAGSEMTIKNKDLANEYKSAGYIEEMGAEMTPSQMDMKKSARKAKATTNTNMMEFAEEAMPLSEAQKIAEAQVQQSKMGGTASAQNASMQSNAMNTEFSQELGAVQDQASAEMQAQQDMQSQQQVTGKSANKKNQ